MDNNQVVIRASKHQYFCKDGDGAIEFLKAITVKAVLDGQEVGRLTAIEVDLPNIYADGDISTVGDAMDTTAELSQMCEFVFGMWGTDLLFAPEKYWDTTTYTDNFIKLAKKHGYCPPDVELEQTDFDYKLIFVDRLSVEPAYLRSGIGSMLVQALGRRNWLSKDEGKASFIVLRAFPFQSKCWSLPDDSAEQQALFDQEAKSLKSFYQKLGFSGADSSEWMLHCPNMLYRLTQAKKKALSVVACAA